MDEYLTMLREPIEEDARAVRHSVKLVRSEGFVLSSEQPVLW